ncbi:DUF2513 domain-containing protein, partial [Pseudomonas aeruginosa]
AAWGAAPARGPPARPPPPPPPPAITRDWGLIRDLLEHLESLGFGQHWEARELPGHCREAVAYHLQLLNQAQLLCGSVQHSWTGQEHWVVHHLTLAGHDLLDRLRQESAAAAVPVRKSA